MLVEIVVSELLSETTKLLHALVDMLMACTDITLHGSLFIFSNERAWAFAVFGTLSDEAIIRFHPLVLLQEMNQAPPKALNVIVQSSWEWPINENNMSCFDAENNKVSQTTFLLELVARKLTQSDFVPEIRAIHRC